MSLSLVLLAIPLLVPSAFSSQLIYSYEDDPLPTVIANGTSPLETGLPPPAFDMDGVHCVLDPRSIDSQFNLLSSSFVPIVNENGKLLPLSAPASEEEAIARGPPEDYVAPVYFFEKPDNAPDGVYDIIYVGDTLQYVAMTSQGDAVLTSSSTGTTPIEQDGQLITTSVFGVDCQGHITVTHDGQSYDWDVSEDELSTAFMPEAATQKKTMVAYSLQMQTRIKHRRGNKYAEGRVPRCPNDPPGLVARVFPGARGLQPNGCGTGKGVHWVPDLNFGSCCNAHDNCYDDCENGTFESCNSAFHNCMLYEGCDKFKGQWYSWIVHFGCLKAADFYFWAVTTKFGRDAFRHATYERCGCYCPTELGLCGRGDRDYHCASTHGPTADVNNCGTCGRVCSARAKCSEEGQCICPHDQCDGRCVDVQTHPNNCGTCGNKCDSGYCVEGKCQVPTANDDDDPCIPVQGFTNGGFTNGSLGWQMCEDGCGISNDVGRKPDDAHAFFSLKNSSQGEITTKVKMCPFTPYEISFSTRRLAGRSTCDVEYTFGEVFVVGARETSRRFDFADGKDTAKHFVGPYPVPIFLKGAKGTAINGNYLDVDFTAVVTCTNDTARVALDDFELVPSQSDWDTLGPDVV